MRFIAVSIVVLFAALFAAPGQLETPVAYAEFECGTGDRYSLTIEIEYISGEPVEEPGAIVTFFPDPQDGLDDRDYIDNVLYDDSPLIGTVQELNACSTTEGDEYSITLDWTDDLCTPVDAQKDRSLTENRTVTFQVHDCEAPPTATPVPATSTPVPATATPIVVVATATPTPPPTAVPQLLIQCTNGEVRNASIGEFCPAPTSVPLPTLAPAVAVVPSFITPPNTGTGGIR